MLKPSYFGYYNRYFISLQVYDRYQQSFLFSSGLISLPSYTRNICPRTLNYLTFTRLRYTGTFPYMPENAGLSCLLPQLRYTGTFPYMPENTELSCLLPQLRLLVRSRTCPRTQNYLCLYSRNLLRFSVSPIVPLRRLALPVCFSAVSVLLFNFLYLIYYFISFISFVASE